MGTLMTRLGSRFLRFRREFLVMAHALRHPATPLRLKLAGGAVLLYLLSPLDLIPITIPFLGVLDDALLVPWGVGKVVKALPAGARADAEAGAARFVERWVKRPLLAFVVVLALLLLIWMTLLWLFWRFVLA